MSSKDKPILKLKASGWTTLLLASLLGVVAVILYSKQHAKKEEPQDNVHQAQEYITEYTTDLKQIAQQCSRMANEKHSIAIFSNGSCVRIDQPTSNSPERAKSSLKLRAFDNLSFEVKLLKNNDYLIVFDSYLFVFCFANDLAKIKDQLLADPRLDKSSADSNQVSQMPDFNRRIGKFARLILLQDAQSMVIEKIITHQP